MKRAIPYLFALILMVLMLGVLNISAKETKKAPTKVPVTTQNVPETTTKPKKKKLPKKVRKFQKKKTKFKKFTLINKKKVELKWKKMKGAKGYLIYRKKNKGKIKLFKKVKKSSTLKMRDKKARYGNTYTYYIKGYMKYKGKKYYSNYKKAGQRLIFKTKKVRKKKYTWICDMKNKKVKNVLAFLKHPKFCLRVNLVKSTMTVFAKDGKRGYRIPVRIYLCAGNIYDTAGKYKLGPKYRFRGLYYNSHSQWSARIYEDILFHTCLYKRSQDPNSLKVKTYNKLGTPSSHGCIRLQCGAAKFIYDKCPVGTRVVFTKSKKSGPLKKPKLEKLKKWHTWDPTDPTMKWKCKKHHCKHKKYYR